MALILRSLALINGQDASGGPGARAGVPPAPQPNPSTFSTPGVHVWGVPRGVTTVTVEQWAGGGAGQVGQGSLDGGFGAGGGGYAKYTLSAPILAPGGVLTVTVAGGATDPTASGGFTQVEKQGGGAPNVKSTGGDGGSIGASGGTNMTTAGTGLGVITTDGGGGGGPAEGAFGGTGGGGGGGGKSADGGAKNANGQAGIAPGGGGGGGGGGTTVGGVGAPGKVVISH